MIRSARQKLRSGSGATVVFAMVVFMIASIFSLVIVESAHTAVANAYDLAEDEQQYLLASSAAHLVQDMIAEEGGSGGVSVTKRVYQRNDGDGWYESKTIYPDSSGNKSEPFTTAIHTMMSASGAQKELAICSGKEMADQVSLTLKRRGGANLAAELCLERDGNRLYPMTVYFDGTERYIGKTVTEYGTDEDGNLDESIIIEYYEETVMTWHVNRVEKGGAR